MTNYQLFFATASFVISSAGLLTTWVFWRNRELRREEVAKWADECIDTLQRIFLLSNLSRDIALDANDSAYRRELAFRSSVLIERGRLFFQNETANNWGGEKLPAYQGYRPQILDHLVLGHQVATIWPRDSEEQAQIRTQIAEKCVKSFVSLAQKEVGRVRAASVEALKGGENMDLEVVMREASSQSCE